MYPAFKHRQIENVRNDFLFVRKSEDSRESNAYNESSANKNKIDVTFIAPKLILFASMHVKKLSCFLGRSVRSIDLHDTTLNQVGTGFNWAKAKMCIANPSW